MAIKKIRMRPEGTNDYGDILHPETSAEQVKGGALPEITKSLPNTSNTVGQIRNITLSPNDADVNLMGDGEIWIKYK